MFAYFKRETGEFVFSSNIRSDSTGYHEIELPVGASGFDYMCELVDGVPTLQRQVNELSNGNQIMLNNLLTERKELIDSKIIELEDELEFGELDTNAKASATATLTAWRKHRYEFRKYTPNAEATDILPLPKECI